MGVKDLWHILSPICERKSLWELRDQVVAIDLSVWICENQAIDSRSVNLYLRNVFFRTSYMLLLGIKPIFVLEGTAPELKCSEMKRRRDVQNKSNLRNIESGMRINRSRLKFLQERCEELLNCMGVDCIYSQGEAEAMCALLNKRGIAKGVITKDSDCFLYGARTVYRNFNMSFQGGTFEKYDMDTIEKKLNLGRNKLIAMSLLCGCDYNKEGVKGVGKETALKFLATISDMDVLDRLTKWTDDSYSTGNLCKLEETIRQKAIRTRGFPFYEIQNEFRNYDVEELNFEYAWRLPNVKKFVMLAGCKMAWSADYAIEKFLPLLSRWYLLYDKTSSLLHLQSIVKKRTMRGVQSYEVKWKDFDHHVIEPMSYLQLKYQREMNEFELAKAKNKSTKKKLETKKDTMETMFDSLVENIHNLSIDLPIDVQILSSVPEEPDDGATVTFNESITVSDFECSAADLDLSSLIQSIVDS